MSPAIQQEVFDGGIGPTTFGVYGGAPSHLTSGTDSGANQKPGHLKKSSYSLLQSPGARTGHEQTSAASSQAHTPRSVSALLVEARGTNNSLTPPKSSVRRKLLGASPSSTTVGVSRSRYHVSGEDTSSAIGQARKTRGLIARFGLASRDDFYTLVRSLINLVGAAMFTIGSAYFVAGDNFLGCLIFGLANICCYLVSGIWWAVLADQKVKAADETARLLPPDAVSPALRVTTVVMGTASPVPGYVSAAAASSAFRVTARIEIFAAAWQCIGSVAFTLGCVTVFVPGLEIETLLFWLAGCFFFLLQSVTSQILCESFWGPLLPLWPRSKSRINIQKQHATAMGVGAGQRRFGLHACVPGAFLNMLGSATFCVGSWLLFYPKPAWWGGFCYLLGSIYFTIAAAADVIGFIDAARAAAFEPAVLTSTP